MDVAGQMSTLRRTEQSLDARVARRAQRRRLLERVGRGSVGAVPTSSSAQPIESSRHSFVGPSRGVGLVPQAPLSLLQRVASR